LLKRAVRVFGMLKATKEKLDALYAGGRLRGIDGKLHKIDSNTRVSFEQGETIADLHREIRPYFSVEIGLAYGFSTLFILDSMKRGRYGRHVAVDPYQISLWHGIGLKAVRDAGLASPFAPFSRFRWMKERAAFALSKMQREKTRAQFVYIDGSHLFDYALSDFCLSGSILDIGGVVLIDDVWMPAVARVVDFISNNMPCYTQFDVGCHNLACFQKTGWDERPWDHFVDF
jgi:predicted O-methyltransferase YrrM